MNTRAAFQIRLGIELGRALLRIAGGSETSEVAYAIECTGSRLVHRAVRRTVANGQAANRQRIRRQVAPWFPQGWADRGAA